MARYRRRRKRDSRLTGLLIIIGFIIAALLLERAGCADKPKPEPAYGTNTGTQVDEPAPTMRIGANGSTTVAA